VFDSTGCASGNVEKRKKQGGCSNLRERVTLATWPTPMAGTPAQNGNNAAGNNDSSRRTVELAHWPTARKLDGEINESLETWSKRRDRKAAEGITLHFPLTIAAQMATWPTPRREDSESTGAHRGKPDTLHSATQLASWATPAARDWHGASGSTEFLAERAEQTRGKPLSEQVYTLTPGPTLPGSSAATEKPGQLNPAFSL